MRKSLFSLSLLCAAMAVGAQPALADTVNVEFTVKEVDIPIDNAGNTRRMWTYDGAIPGPLVRVKQGDVVHFTLKNDSGNANSHSIDFHASRLDVLDEFSEIKPGDTKQFEFKADYPGVFMYHCGAEAMAEHISNGMYGIVIVDPAEGYSDAFPKPDREYVLVQGDLFEDGASPEEITMGERWRASLINGKIFHYDPVHDPNASLALEAKPGERVRFYFVNAAINEASALHPIAGIWDRVWDNGNPKNISYGMQTVEIGPAHGVILDMLTPEGRDSNNAIVDHRMKHAMNGAITVLMTHDGADPAKGAPDQMILRE
ncbi:MAG TPA: multicopper oxidase domain-containing protein [Hyphomicrobiales bacterium]|nr:multicopper oxidase domain-containing protein [Hyphomicrobiales bacterium]